MLTRVHAISDPKEIIDPTYAESLRAAVSAALEYGLAGIEHGEEHAPPPPPTLLAQARLAARNRISLDTVLRRYFAGYALLGDFLVEEAEAGELLASAELKRLLRTQAALFDHLIAAVSADFVREAESRPTSVEQRRAERVERLLAGELLDASELAYDFDGRHLAIVATGPEVIGGIREVSASLDQRLLVVRRAEGIVWAWLGSRGALDPGLVEQELLVRSKRSTIALGEPGEGLSAWRLSHRQALAALPIARRGPEALVRYSDVALLASVLADDLLSASLRELYLDPLENERGGGEAARQILRAYFAADRQVSSTAAALGLDRNTVARRLRGIEQMIGRPLETCAAELEVALRLDDLKGPAGPHIAESSLGNDADCGGKPPNR